jgi:hypothetical protein
MVCMRLVTKLGVFLVLGVLLAACGGDKKDGGGILSPGRSPSSGGGTSTSGGGSGSTGALSEMSLVYVDSRDGTPHLFVARADGSSPRKVADLKQGTRPYDMRGGILLAGGGDQLMLVDLRDGKTVDTKPNGPVTDARFIDEDTIIFATNGSCGGPDRKKAMLQSMNLKDGSKKELFSNDGVAVSIAGVGKDGTIAVAPRGCDVSVSEIQLINVKGTPAPVKTETRGCGWAIVSPETTDAVVSLKSCTPPADKKDVDAIVYALGGASRAPRDLKAPAGGSNPSIWVLRPGGKEAALATSQTTGTAAGSTRSTGVWLVDLRSGEFKDLAPAAGAEQFPVSWTADGRYLLAASVEAQGVCSFSVIDVNEKKVTPLPETLSFCGPNGVVLGLTVIR